MSLVSIDTEKCLKDGLCKESCPGELFEFRPGECPIPIADIDANCIRCGHCVAICPAHCLTHTEIPQNECIEIKKEFEISAEAAAQFLKSRRTTRKYKSKPLPRHEIEKVLDIARYAPTGHNDQNVRWCVFDNKKTLKAISDATIDFFRFLIKTQPKADIPFDLNRLVDIYDNGTDLILWDAPVVLVAHSNKNSPMDTLSCYIALSTLELAAKGCGLGTCWAGFMMFAIMSGFGPLLEIVNLPDDQQFAGAMMFGYPKLNYQRVPARKKPVIVWKDE